MGGAAAIAVAFRAGQHRVHAQPDYLTDTSFTSKYGVEVTWGKEWEPYAVGSYVLPESTKDHLVLSLGGPFASGNLSLNVTVFPSTPEIESDPMGFLWAERSAGVPDGIIQIEDEVENATGVAFVTSTDEGDVSAIGYSELRLPPTEDDPVVMVSLSCKPIDLDVRELRRGLRTLEIGNDDAIEVMDTSDVLDTLERLTT